MESWEEHERPTGGPDTDPPIKHVIDRLGQLDLDGGPIPPASTTYSGELHVYMALSVFHFNHKREERSMQIIRAERRADRQIVECCVCKTEIDTKDSDIPARWFGLYHWRALARIICADCAKKPENKAWWT